MRKISRSTRNALMLAGLIIFAYFGSAIVFRQYRMDPKNKYPGIYLQGGGTRIAYGEEDSRKMFEDMFQGPTLLERIYIPAERIMRWLGI